MKSWLLSFFYLFNIKKNILSRLFVVLMTVMVFSLLVIVFIWNNSIHTTIHNLSLSHVTDVVKNANKNFEDDLHDLLMNINVTAQNYNITQYLSDSSEVNTTNLEHYLRNTYESQQSKLNAIAFITNDTIITAGMSYFPEDVRESDWYRTIVDNAGSSVIVNRAPKLDGENSNEYSIGKLIKYSGQKPAVLVFNITEDFVIQNFGTSNMNGILNTIIVDENKNVIYSTTSNIGFKYVNLLYTAAKNQTSTNAFSTIELFGETYLLTSKKFASSPKWTNITFFPRDALYKNYTDTINLTVWCMILVTVFAILIAYVFSTKISKKFKSLSMHIDNISFNNLSSHPELNSADADEIDNVSNKINQMVDTISSQVSTISELEEKKHSYEMQILKAQINPHLIYNTLNAIQSLAEIQNSKSISTITKALSELLQYSVDNTNTMVTLADEIQYIKNYIQVMQCKFLNQINLVVNVEEDLYNCMMLKMTLQPLVENALKHWLEDKPEEYVMIKAYRSETGISIKIIDNGIGIEPEVLENLIAAPDENGVHVGLNNVNRRIKLTFGEEYGISIYSTLGIQTTVIIDIPYLPS